MALQNYTYEGQAIISEPDGALNSGAELDNAIRMDRSASVATWPGMTGPCAANYKELSTMAIIQSTGTSIAYNVTVSPGASFSNYASGVGLTLSPHVDSGNNPTINVNGLGVKNILRPDGAQCSALDLRASSAYKLIYNGVGFVATELPASNYLVLNPKSASTAQLSIGSSTNDTSPVIDFRSKSLGSTYDVRLSASGGTASNAQGTLQISASTTNITGQVVMADTLGVATTLTATTINATTANITNLNFIPAGTKIPFYNTSVPAVGWTLANPGTNYVLVSAATGGTVGGGAGRGDNLVTGCTIVPDHTHSVSITGTTGAMSNSNTHSHTYTDVREGDSFGAATGGMTNTMRIATAVGGVTSTVDINHNHSVSGSGYTSVVNGLSGASTAVGTWSPLYATVCIGQKT